ncbi:MAG: ankyrin repeat domain-containing protein, partial [Myxococcales bacterium]|nr:ankyrin repeat domain-containing protein [Myxococcales bacterium]
KQVAKLGVTWPTAEEDAIAQARADEAVREARLAPVDRALLVAAHAGDLDGVKRALAEGANLEVAMPDGELPFTPAGSTPLLLALRGDHRAVVGHLIAAGADVNASAPAWGGLETPLRLAAAQGNVELTRALLARGASVRPETASWGILQQVTYPAPGRPVGSPAAYAEVIRMLLDAGAPLPNDSHCNTLAKMVVAGGKPELEPRLRRVYAEVTLPEEPAAIDTAASAGRVSLLLERAADAFTRDTVESLGALVEAWRLSLNPRIADAAEGMAKLVRGPRPALATGSGPADGEALVAAVKAMREGTLDPRSARAILSWLWITDIYTNKAWMGKAEDEAAAVLVMLRDVRFIESLELNCERGRPITAQPVRESLKVALRVMKAVMPGVLTDADVDHLGAIEDRLANRKPTSARPTVRDLFEAVYEAGHDIERGDQARRVLASRLTEAGDPRGELITLQMSRRAGKVTKREKELLKTHGRAWLGEIGAVLEEDVVFERGFVVDARVVGGTSGGPWYRVLASGAGTQPEWSTIRRLRLAGYESPGLLRGARTQRIAELVDVGRGHLQELLGGPPRPSLRRLELADTRRQRSQRASPLDGAAWSSLPEKLPSLEGLHVAARGEGLEGVEGLVRRLPKLRELGVGSDEPMLVELVELARRCGLEKVCSLGLVDLSFTLSTGFLGLAFHDVLRPEHASIAEQAIATMGELGVKRVKLHTPPRAKIERDGKGRPKKLARRAESVPLWPIIEALAPLGLS